MSICKITIYSVVLTLALLILRHSHAQAPLGETLSGPDSHEFNPEVRGHLLGNCGGRRSRLQEKGVLLDLQYVADHLWNIESEQKERLASWNRFRGTVDLNLDPLLHWHDTYFHATAVWQAGGKLGEYLGLLTSPSGMSSGDTGPRVRASTAQCLTIGALPTSTATTRS